ncbi:hypothetical protein C2134_19420 [Chromobacterium sinusclupearum]|uniref:Uncharacterized protein n=1 Tax=Chromobacterium sinusclupearum TaxID=2077146 RepID=A0A2K4MJN5_9NEIS|nr:hypothetical protein [Chromobacterium sinusclupearum]POA96945.1 hypothetical protein C2134_19420 [Chromobacterium sinusclupearum]
MSKLRLFSVLSLLLISALQPLRAAPANPDLASRRTPAQVADCLQQGLRKLHIPPDFIERVDASDGSHSLRMRNPQSDASGTAVEILPNGDGSKLNVELNGLPLSPAWKRLLRQCGATPL